MTQETQEVKVPMIETGMFVEVLTDEYKDYGIDSGDRLFVAGDGLVPVSEEDPYLYKRLMLCAKMDSHGHILAGEGATTIDGRKLRELGEEESDMLEEVQRQDFKEVEGEVVDETVDA